MVWSNRSRVNLHRVNPHLIAVLTAAAVDFERSTDFLVVVVSGFRSDLDQMKMYEAGATTLRTGSKHQSGDAVDVALISKSTGKLSEAFWLYEQFNDAVQFRSMELSIPVEWGGKWKSKDGPHFQL